MPSLRPLVAAAIAAALACSLPCARADTPTEAAMESQLLDIVTTQGPLHTTQILNEHSHYAGTPADKAQYDDTAWARTFGDPQFVNHRAEAQLLALFTMRFAQDEMLPYRFANYAPLMRLGLARLAKSTRNPGALRARLTRIRIPLAMPMHLLRSRNSICSCMARAATAPWPSQTSRKRLLPGTHPHRSRRRLPRSTMLRTGLNRE